MPSTAMPSVSVWIGRVPSRRQVPNAPISSANVSTSSNETVSLVPSSRSQGELWRACQPQAQVRRAVDAGVCAPVDQDDARAVRAAYADLVRTDAGRALVAQAGTAIGSALAHVVELVDVPRVVVGGGVALASGVTLVDAVRDRLEARLASPPSVASTAFGEDGVARGAACSVLEALLAPGSDGLALGPR